MYKKPFHNTELSRYSFLVTGGAGFIGSNIVEYLIRYGAGKVRVVDNLSTGYKQNIEEYLDNPSFEFIEENICNIEVCNRAATGMDFIIHQAALGSVSRSVENPIGTNESNVTGFLNILQSAKDNKIKRVVYASSSSVYGDNETLPKIEENVGNPLSPYAVSKLVNELYAGVFARIYGMEIIGLRYFNVFGPRQSPKGPYAAVVPLFIDAMKNSVSPFIFGDGEQSRDFTFVEN
ncbi:MAG: NAD-dependent epimerase/dehydratase family protein, partial [Bacteroidota bacterium]|nr:NAD-dependent epimerase/dehydratase family protein [Bacteroidota bacterium]